MKLFVTIFRSVLLPLIKMPLSVLPDTTLPEIMESSALSVIAIPDSPLAIAVLPFMSVPMKLKVIVLSSVTSPVILIPCDPLPDTIFAPAVKDEPPIMLLLLPFSILMPSLPLPRPTLVVPVRSVPM